ncbi:MAG: M20/M25/M40 family metallo-hydrolase [Bacteroidales bacterium]|nr:M20/M25/M40 family metallo-hydrolase [Bacteroidales bacterium]
MSPESPKNRLSITVLLFILGITLFLVTCTKDDGSEEIEWESITRKLTNDISADSLQSYVSWLEGMGTRFTLADNHRDVALQIQKKFKMLGYSNCRLDSFMLDRVYEDIRYQQWQYNVIATLEGIESPDSICIAGAHYDDNLISGDPFAVAPGANDNASGVAAVIELARVFMKGNFSPRNSIEFIAFGAEELGLYGSKAYAAEAAGNSKKIKLMLNNDMIAYEPLTTPSSWIVDIKDYDNSHDLRQEAERMCTKFTSLEYKNDNTYNRQSDSYPFFEHGYKALFFFSNTMDPLYHSLNDRSVNCNFAYCREIVKVSCALLVYNN